MILASLQKPIALILCVIPAHATTVALIWTPQEIVVAADSAALGEAEPTFCKIRQVGNTFFAVEGMVDVFARTNGKPDSANSFHVIPHAQLAAKMKGSVADKAIAFEREVTPVLQRIVTQAKKFGPDGYKAYLLHPHQALQVVFFGMNADKTPAYALISLGVQENANGNPIVQTVEKGFCPGQGCVNPDTRILGEGEKAFELTKRPDYPGPDRAVAARNLIEAEVQDKPKLVRPPIDILRISILGPIWTDEKPQCVAVNGEEVPNPRPRLVPSKNRPR